MRNAMILAAALAALSGCGQGDDAPAPVAANGTGPAPAERLAGMAEEQRNAVFIRAIRDAGLECQHVESSEAAGEYQGRPVWNARCTGGGNWTIVLGDGDVAQILNADEARLVQPLKPQR